jgi:hypothetical protein
MHLGEFKFNITTNDKSFENALLTSPDTNENVIYTNDSEILPEDIITMICIF